MFAAEDAANKSQRDVSEVGALIVRDIQEPLLYRLAIRAGRDLGKRIETKAGL